MIYFCAKPIGFYDSSIHSEIPENSVEITADHRALLLKGESEGKIISANSKGQPVLNSAKAVAPEVPTMVTMRQARLALNSRDLLQSVESAISSLPESEQKIARIEWDYASRVERSSQFVVMIGTAIGLDDAQMDELFIAASIL